MIRRLVYGLLTLGLLSLAAGLTMAGYWAVGLVLLLLTPLCLTLVKRKFLPALDLCLTLTVLTAAIGLWRNLNLSIALMSILCLLAAWDLDNFSRRLAFVSTEDNPGLIERQHLVRVSQVVLLGAAISILARTIRFTFSFEWAIALIIFTFIGIGALINWLRAKES